MRGLVRTVLRYRVIALIGMAAWLAAGIWALVRLDIEAYPDPSPPLVEVITQNPSWSAEEMEQQVTVPIETALNGIPRLQYVRSISIFGLSDVKLYFDFDSDYFRDRQEVLNRLQTVTLPQNLQPQLSPWSAVGEIYRYQLKGEGYSLNELKATQDWFVRRELKQVPGIIDVTTFGGTTKQYQAEIDPQKLLQYNVTLPQVLTAIAASNQNAGGNYLQAGAQNVNVRGIGLLKSVAEMESVLIAERNGVPVFLRHVADVHEGYQPPLGRVGRNADGNIVEGIVLLQRGEQSLPALKGLRAKIRALNEGLLPRGMKIGTIYDRTALITITTDTVLHVVLTGLLLVTLLLLVFLGDIPLALVTALTIPFAVLFAFGLMSVTGRSANLISIGAIDFGIIVDSAIVVLENIYRRMHEVTSDEQRLEVIAEATAEAAKPVLFSTLIILVAFLPLFTMQGVPGRIFAPMSITYGFALTGALIFALVFALIAAACLSTPTWAQQPRFTWEQIQYKFLSTNPTLKAQAQSIESTRASEIAAGLRPNPTFQNDTTSATAGIYQEFEIGGKRSARLQSARLATSISQTDFDDVRRTLIFNLRQAFIAALQAQSDLDFARDNLANYQKIIDLNRLMFEQGEISRADFLKVELQMLQFQSDVDDATLALKTAKATLRAFVGPSNLPQEFQIQGDLKTIPLEKSLPDLQQLALSNRPDLKYAETGREKIAADLRLAKANRWPDPTIGASFLHTGNEIGGPNWFTPFYPEGPTTNAMGLGIASIALPIFNRNQGEIARAQSEQLRADFLVQAARNQVLQDVETAYASFESSRERIRLYEEIYLSRAKESLDIEEFSFRNGAASILDFLDAERTYRATQLAYRQQLAAYLANLAQLEEAVGVSVTP